MSEATTKVGMTPCHPGEFIRAEILHELNLPVARAAEIGVRPRPCPIWSLARLA
jgi:plasmid maintenance system antidote protein VapI